MKFLDELKSLKSHLLSWFLTFLIVAFTVFTIGIAKAEIMGIHLHLPVFSANSFAVMFFELVKNNLVPKGVTLIATGPSSAFVTQTLIALLGAFIITFPFLLYKIFEFLSPALYNKEKKTIFKILIPSGLLFMIGVIFSYFIIIPPTFRVLYSFNEILGVMPFFIVSEFVSWTLALMFMTGTMFLLPIFMYLLTWIGVISSKVWFKNWRIALAVFLILSAVLTPDGTGVTMVYLSLPMMFLYMVGAFLGRIKEKKIPKKNYYA